MSGTEPTGLGSPLLSVENLSVDFGVGEGRVQAVRGVSFSVQAGETLALVGESGSGKSVSALSILRLLAYPPASHPSGRIMFDGEDILQVGDRRLRGIRGNDIALVPQEPMSSLNPLHSVERQIGETLMLHQGMGRAAARARTLELLDEVGIPDPLSRLDYFPHQLSGGQRQRVMIAMALANAPRLLIADEPTTSLDVTVQAQILALLKDLQKRFNMGMIFITHDLGIVRNFADRMCVMQHGEIVEQGAVVDLFARPQHAYTKHLMASEPVRAARPTGSAEPVILEAEALRVWFPIRQGLFRKTTGHLKAVDDVSLTVRRGQTLGIVGESGSGKSTLALAVLRLVSSTGRVAFLGRDMQGLNSKQVRPLRADMQIVFQDPFGALSPRMTIAEIIAEGLGVHFPEMTEGERDAKVVAAMDDVDLDPQSRHRYPHEFSGGQRQRVAIARALILQPKLLVLDEPTSALDKSVQVQIVDLLRALQERHGLTYLFISHDLKVVRALADQLIVMKDGKIVEEGAAEEIFAAPQEPYTRTLLAAALNPGAS